MSPAASRTAPITINEEPRKSSCVWRNLRISAPANVRPRPMTATCALVGRIASKPATTANAPMVAITLIARVPVSAAAARWIWSACWGVIVPSASSLATSTRSFIGQSDVTNDQRSKSAQVWGWNVAMDREKRGTPTRTGASPSRPSIIACVCITDLHASAARGHDDERELPFSGWN
jgi:hypothetical protein